jgi:hypothetical protein
MNKRSLLFLMIMFSCFNLVNAQKIIKAESIVKGEGSYNEGRVTLIQDPAIDTLLTRHIIANRKHGGFDGFRIQIYNGSKRTARDEAMEVNSDFISEFPGIESYLDFAAPNFFKVRVGNYRTRRDAMHDFLVIKKKFPNAYIVPDIIKFPDLDN